MLYTGRGDSGMTKTFGDGERISKASAIIEALGTMDEINSFLGLVKVRAAEAGYTLPETRTSMAEVVGMVQHDLFTIQAELAGADKRLNKTKLTRIEKYIAAIDQALPPITTFFVSGGTELAARFDVARTLARRAERRVVEVMEHEALTLGTYTLAYLNRLSSLLYALARFTNHSAGISEEAPTYR